MRGKRSPLFDELHSSGSIPAHAGETAIAVWSFVARGVYPRTCGGNPGVRRDSRNLLGLSPHMRGKPTTSPEILMPLGSIPAHAGETESEYPAPLFIRVYPRTCGGNSSATNGVPAYLGLSPHMRGKLRHASPSQLPKGSIPAHAGETAPGDASPRRSWVYPRTCGGNSATGNFRFIVKGLSPHMRGKLGSCC